MQTFAAPFRDSLSRYAGRIGDVRYLPDSDSAEFRAVSFTLDGIPHAGELRGPNVNLKLSGLISLDTRIVVRMILCGDAKVQHAAEAEVSR